VPHARDVRKCVNKLLQVCLV